MTAPLPPGTDYMFGYESILTDRCTYCQDVTPHCNCKHNSIQKPMTTPSNCKLCGSTPDGPVDAKYNYFCPDPDCEHHWVALRMPIWNRLNERREEPEELLLRFARWWNKWALPCDSGLIRSSDINEYINSTPAERGETEGR